MKKQITVNLVEGFKMTAHNSHTSMGQYYAEDDWTVTVIGESWAEVFKQYWETEYNESMVYPDNYTFEKVKFIEYDGQKLITESEEISKYDRETKDEYNSLYKNLQIAPEAADAHAARAQKLAAKKEQEKLEHEQEQKQKNMAEFNRLKELLGDEAK
jgi:hypothetical protein